MIKYIFPFILVILFTGCSHKNRTIQDTQKYSQNPSSYIQNLKTTNLEQEKLSKELKQRYFEVWDQDKISYTKDEASWGNIYASKTIYLENHLKASKKWFEKQIDNSNFEKYNRVIQKAILVRNTNFRVFPTDSKMFYNPSRAGQGFPFDYNQNSRVKINTPILVSHYSKDKAWAFVQSNYVLGWVKIDNILLINEKIKKDFIENELYVIIKEGFHVFDSNILEDLKVGTFFPKKNDKYLLATNNGIKEVNIDEHKVSKMPLEFNISNIETLSKEFIGELYGWGGLNNHRDCSSFTQDFFSPFGIYLKRNSKGQTQLHKYLDIAELSDEKKKEFIKKNAIPFLSLIYLKGHIMLYIGEQKGEPLVMHNMWGVRTWEFPFTQGRNIVGKTVITTLEPGIELNNVDKNKTILRKVQGVVLLNEKVDKESIKDTK